MPEQPLGLGRAGAYTHLALRPLGLAYHHRGVRALMRVDSDHHCCHHRGRSPADYDQLETSAS